jgi:Zn ribbon nucleic-acid-binding protein
MTSDVFVDTVSCPKCKAIEIRVLPFSEESKVWHWFLRCVVCGHEWTIAKATKVGPPARAAHA